ncbi:hypothetical protein H9P43_007024 [Blastocladiella emersonii ATCC 22665]|nr:hypothetical protein H9P43_007024 [Blastocladiella emersonii ATCC 22665]
MESTSATTLTAPGPSAAALTDDTAQKIRRILAVADGESTRSGSTPASNPAVETLALADRFSRSDFLARLRSYLHSTFAFSPSNLSPVHLAAHGWEYSAESNESQLVCRQCNASILLSPLLESAASPDSTIVKRYRALTESNHAATCAWRQGPCPESTTSGLPAIPPSRLLREMQARVADLERILTESVSALVSSEPEIPDAVAARFSDASPTSLRLALANWSPACLSGDAPREEDSSDHVALSCSYCCRRVGLWTFAKETKLDPIAAHKWYCPWSSTGDAWSTTLRRLAPPRPSTSSVPSDQPETTVDAALDARRSTRKLVSSIRALIHASTAGGKRQRDEDLADAARWEKWRRVLLPDTQ